MLYHKRSRMNHLGTGGTCPLKLLANRTSLLPSGIVCIHMWCQCTCIYMHFFNSSKYIYMMIYCIATLLPHGCSYLSIWPALQVKGEIRLRTAHVECGKLIHVHREAMVLFPSKFRRLCHWSKMCEVWTSHIFHPCNNITVRLPSHKSWLTWWVTTHERSATEITTFCFKITITFL